MFPEDRDLHNQINVARSFQGNVPSPGGNASSHGTATSNIIVGEVRVQQQPILFIVTTHLFRIMIFVVSVLHFRQKWLSFRKSGCLSIYS